MSAAASMIAHAVPYATLENIGPDVAALLTAIPGPSPHTPQTLVHSGYAVLGLVASMTVGDDISPNETPLIRMGAGPEVAATPENLTAALEALQGADDGKRSAISPATWKMLAAWVLQLLEALLTKGATAG